jgi:hypothetical protein
MNDSTLHILRDNLIGKKIVLAYDYLKRGNDHYYEIHRGKVTDIYYQEKRKILYVTLDNTRVYSFTDNGGYKLDDDSEYDKNYMGFFTGELFNLIRL